MSWLETLERELRASGVPPGRRRRIVAELADHLACDPDARLGEPSEIARQFANELGTVFARRAAYATFLALAPFGVLFAALFALAAVYTANSASRLTLPLVLGVQLAFVGGTLGLLRGWRLRRVLAMPAAEARVLLRRAVLGLVGGAMAAASLTALASVSGLGEESWMSPLAWSTVGVGWASVLVGVGALVRSARLLPLADGPAGDLGFDLGLGVDPRKLAVAIASLVALCIALGGIVQADPIDGLARAFGDGLLCLAGFAVLGRPLGLRR